MHFLDRIVEPIIVLKARPDKHVNVNCANCGELGLRVRADEGSESSGAME